MSSRSSESSVTQAAGAPHGSDPGAGAAPDRAPRRQRSGWGAAIRANGLVPLVLLLLVPLGWFFESRTFGAYNTRVVMLIGFNVILAVSLQLINGFSGQFSLGHAGFMAVGAYLAAYPAITYSRR